MTYEEILTQVVQKKGWNTLQEFELHETRTSVVHSLTKEAALLYAKAKHDEGAEYMKREILRVYQQHLIPGNCFESLYKAKAPKFIP